jgi:cold shock protein
MEGTVKWYDATKGFGFIQTSENKDIFVHRSGIQDGFLSLEPDQKVEFDTKESDRGPVAINVKVI